MPPEAMIPLAAHLALLVGVAATFTLLLRGARVPGGRPAAAVVGGIVAGTLLGPMVAGRAWPQWHERLAVGGARERAALEALESRQQADLAALRATGVTPTAVEELAQAHAAERAGAEAALARARVEHRRPRVFVLSAMLAAALACAAWAGRRARPAGPGERLAAGAAGIGAALFAALPTALLLCWLAAMPMARALACGGAVAAGSLFCGLTLRRPAPAGRSADAAVLALTCSFGAALVLAWGLRPDAAGWLLIPAAGLGVGAVFAAMSPAGARGRRAARAVVSVLVMPAVTAYVAQQVEWDLLLGVWTTALVVLVGIASAGDGHFIGAWLALQTFAPERQRARAGALAMELVASGLGLTQAAMALVLIAGGIADPATREGQAALALLLGNAAAIELLAGLNRRALRMLGGG